jgi:hypothetical protein
VCVLVLAATIGGASLGSHSGLQATKFDSYTNMAVAGIDCTVIATSGCHATVTPFFSKLPKMDMVEIGDVAIAYDDPISLLTYLLVMRIALLIPTMDHNLIPTFLMRQAGLYVDEMPKDQCALPMIDNHVIYDSDTRLRIHLALNGIFSFFRTQALTLEEMENWENYPIVFITPGGDAWDPNTSHSAENEAAMLDSNVLIIEHDTRPPQVLFMEVDLGKLYGKPVGWDEFNDAIDLVYTSDSTSLGCPLTEAEVVKLNVQFVQNWLVYVKIANHISLLRQS